VYTCMCKNRNLVSNLFFRPIK